MHKKFEINHTKIKGGCQSGSKVVPHDSKSDLPLVPNMTLVSPSDPPHKLRYVCSALKVSKSVL